METVAALSRRIAGLARSRAVGPDQRAMRLQRRALRSHGRTDQPRRALVRVRVRRQVDAIMFWDKFRGRWMRHDDFFYPDPPEDIPVMKDPPNLDKFIPKYRN
jgi:hypothetical protein